jgi:hypothetical protein
MKSCRTVEGDRQSPKRIVRQRGEEHQRWEPVDAAGQTTGAASQLDRR